MQVAALRQPLGGRVGHDLLDHTHRWLLWFSPPLLVDWPQEMFERPVGDPFALITSDHIGVAEVNTDIHPRVDGLIHRIGETGVCPRLLDG